MATTLAMRRKYRKSLKKSLCRKKTMRKCNRVRGCKNTKKTAKKPRYCRKKHNKRHTQKGGVGVSDICFKQCIEDAGGTLDGQNFTLPRTAPPNTLMRCAQECQQGRSLYRAADKKITDNA